MTNGEGPIACHSSPLTTDYASRLETNTYLNDVETAGRPLRLISHA